MKPTFSSVNIPEYHEGMLLVEARAVTFSPQALGIGARDGVRSNASLGWICGPQLL
jgi:hypothetical protein